MKILVTGGNGFIGYNFILMALHTGYKVISVDNLSVSSYRNDNELVELNGSYKFHEKDIRDNDLKKFIGDYKFNAIINFAAQTHVDKSIHSDAEFISSNIIGVHNMIASIKELLDKKSLPENFKFIQISTDEVYGSLSSNEDAFTEKSFINPTNPYSASKASADLLCMSYYKTHSFPVAITRCSNNYGPYQYPEKLIPLTIQKIQNSDRVPIYGDGRQIRDWIHVEDHCRGIMRVLESGQCGEIYNFGGYSEIANISCVKKIINQISPGEDCNKYIEYVKDRLGHDTRYAINPKKSFDKLNWKPKYNFDEGILQTVNWYKNNKQWLTNHCESDTYLKWVEKNY